MAQNRGLRPRQREPVGERRNSSGTQDPVRRAAHGDGGAALGNAAHWQLDSVNTRVLHESENEATVRTEFKYATAVGAWYDSRDLKVVKDDGIWKVQWPAEKELNVPPQVIPVTYLRWDIVWRGQGDD